MSLIYNNTNIDTMYYNNTRLNKAYYNNTLVFCSPYIYDRGWSGFNITDIFGRSTLGSIGNNQWWSYQNGYIYVHGTAPGYYFDNNNLVIEFDYDGGGISDTNKFDSNFSDLFTYGNSQFTNKQAHIEYDSLQTFSSAYHEGLAKGTRHNVFHNHDNGKYYAAFSSSLDDNYHGSAQFEVHITKFWLTDN